MNFRGGRSVHGQHTGQSLIIEMSRRNGLYKLDF